jgi:hypothetical protein
MATHVQDKRLIDILLADIGAKVRVLHESEEELVDDLQVRPSEFEYGFVFFRVESVAGRVDLGRDRTEQVARELAGHHHVRISYLFLRSTTSIPDSVTNHSDHLGINSLGDNSPPNSNIIQHLVQSLSLCVLLGQIGRSVVKVENVAALL